MKYVSSQHFNESTSQKNKRKTIHFQWFFDPKLAGRFIGFRTDKLIILTGLPVKTNVRRCQIWNLNFHQNLIDITNIHEFHKNRWGSGFGVDASILCTILTWSRMHSIGEVAGNVRCNCTTVWTYKIPLCLSRKQVGREYCYFCSVCEPFDLLDGSWMI
jgi:hypothetical protein